MKHNPVKKNMDKFYSSHEIKPKNKYTRKQKHKTKDYQ